MSFRYILFVDTCNRCLPQGKSNLNEPWLVVHVFPIPPPKFQGWTCARLQLYSFGFRFPDYIAYVQSKGLPGLERQTDRISYPEEFGISGTVDHDIEPVLFANIGRRGPFVVR